MLAAMIAAALQAGASPPLPPPAPIVDYLPGPFFWPVSGDRDTLAPEFDPAMVRDAAKLGDIGFTVCVERWRAGRPDRRDVALLMRVRALLVVQGVKDVRIADTRCPSPSPPRNVEGVMLTPGIG